MNDSISRQAAIDAPVKMVSEGLDWIPVYHIKGLPPAEPEQRWIPCSEGLPEEGEEVLVYLFDRPSPYIAWRESDVWFTEDFEVDADDNPVAWMPLPEPYKAERLGE